MWHYIAKSVDDCFRVHAEADLDRVLSALVKPVAWESIEDDTEYTDKPGNIRKSTDTTPQMA